MCTCKLTCVVQKECKRQNDNTDARNQQIMKCITQVLLLIMKYELYNSSYTFNNELDYGNKILGRFGPETDETDRNYDEIDYMRSSRHLIRRYENKREATYERSLSDFYALAGLSLHARLSNMARNCARGIVT